VCGKDSAKPEEVEHMCPLCIGSAVIVASSVMSTGGLTALVVKTFGSAEAGAKTTESINKANGAGDAPSK
jgi:hypothetical protein